MVYDRKTTYNRLSVAGVQILMTAQREVSRKNSETSRPALPYLNALNMQVSHRVKITARIRTGTTVNKSDGSNTRS